MRDMITVDGVALVRIPDSKNSYVTNDGRVYNADRKKYVKVGRSHVGKLRVNVPADRDLGYIRRNLDILVAKAYVPNPKGYTKLVHIDGDMDNCRHTNLRWVPRGSPYKHRGAIPCTVYDATTGETTTYPSISTAADAIGVTYPTILHRARRSDVFPISGIYRITLDEEVLFRDGVVTTNKDKLYLYDNITGDMIICHSYYAGTYVSGTSVSKLELGDTDVYCNRTCAMSHSEVELRKYLDRYNLIDGDWLENMPNGKDMDSLGQRIRRHVKSYDYKTDTERVWYIPSEFVNWVLANEKPSDLSMTAITSRLRRGLVKGVPVPVFGYGLSYVSSIDEYVDWSLIPEDDIERSLHKDMLEVNPYPTTGDMWFYLR